MPFGFSKAPNTFMHLIAVAWEEHVLYLNEVYSTFEKKFD